MIHGLRKENYSIKQKIEYKEDYGHVLELESKIKDLEKKNTEL